MHFLFFKYSLFESIETLLDLIVFDVLHELLFTAQTPKQLDEECALSYSPSEKQQGQK